MPDLIPIVSILVSTETKQTFDARDLHAYLGIGKDYSSWIKAQIKRARLVENRDYVIHHPERGTTESIVYGRGNAAIDYHLTLDAGKHIGMISGTPKGFEVREYFIAKEKQVTTSSPLDAYPELRAMADMGKTIIALVTSAAENRSLAEQAQREASAANIKADLAIANQQWLTIREYRYLHKLERQLPDSLCKSYGTYLTGYCLEQGIPVRDQGIADRQWGKEHAYPIEAITKTMPGWLKRRHGQAELRVVEHQP